MTHFEGMRPWFPGTQIIEVYTEHERIDLHNDFLLSMLGIDLERLLPTLSLTFGHSSGKRYRLSFVPIIDLVMVQDPDDWHTYSAARQDEESPRDDANFYSIEFWEGPGELSRFGVQSTLGHLHFKSPLVRWSELDDAGPGTTTVFSGPR